MTVDEAKALAAMISNQLRRYGVGFLVVIEADEAPEQAAGPVEAGAWFGAGNSAGYASMIRAVLAGVTSSAPQTDCAACSLALEHMRQALDAFTPHNRTCH